MESGKKGRLEGDGPILCPHCNKGANGYMETVPAGETVDGTPPVKGSVCVCGYCGNIGIYDFKAGKLIIRKATDKELDDIIKDVPYLDDMVRVIKKSRIDWLKKNN